MARIKFKNIVANCGEGKSSDSLIDSEGSHHLFHSKSSLCSYERIDKQGVQAASELSVLVGKGQVFVPLASGFFFEAYHTLHF